MSSDMVSVERLRLGFKYFTRFMLLMWRLGLGRFFNTWPAVSGRVMVVTHRGRITGKLRRTPLNYAIVDGDIYCTAGFGKVSDWYRNIKENPEVELWLPDSWWAGSVEEVDRQHPGWLALLRQVLIGSGFAAYAAGINPHRIGDEELQQVAAEYRLLRIRRQAARTGPGGPGDLSWVWPLATMILLPLVLFPRNRKR
jgi:deazaflavin-dependent oxidoreductase (nitroreductase family)